MSNLHGWVVPNGLTMPLEEWNEEQRKYWMDARARVMHPELFPNGLMCPSCKTGYLYDTMRILSTAPPVHQVKCISCAFKGERYG